MKQNVNWKVQKVKERYEQDKEHINRRFDVKGDNPKRALVKEWKRGEKKGKLSAKRWNNKKIYIYLEGKNIRKNGASVDGERRTKKQKVLRKSNILEK